MNYIASLLSGGIIFLLFSCTTPQKTAASPEEKEEKTVSVVDSNQVRPEENQKEQNVNSMETITVPKPIKVQDVTNSPGKKNVSTENKTP